MKGTAVFTAGCVLLAGAAGAETRRFALVVGNNAGAASHPPLRYAENDAGKFARVMAELGDVKSENLVLLQGRSARDFDRGLADLKARIAEAHRRPDERAILLFYFSGHGDEQALELAADRLPYSKLKAGLADTGAEIRITIIDACHSGAAVQAKGGTPAPGFTIRLSDTLAASGEAVIASSAASETALESSEVGGSFFTHNLVSGLRGAADLSGDRQVTLAEAYRYAYDHTVSATASATSGGQHPVFDYRLSGQGELVLSTLGSRSALLSLPAGAERWLVTDLARDQVIAEVVPGAARDLGLLPGNYGVRVTRGDQPLGGHFTLAEGQRVTVSWKDLAALPATAMTSRGVSPSDAMRLCVLPFKNLSGDPLDLGDAIEETLYSDLGENSGVKLVERGQIDMDVDLMRFDGKYADPATRAKLGKLHGAEVALLGGYQRFGSKLRVTARFVSVETGEVLHGFKVDAPQADTLELEERVAKEAKRSLVALKERLRP